MGVSDRPQPRQRLAARAIPLLLLLGIAGQASGHGGRLPFNQWGGFGAGDVQCQRVIARSAAQCAAASWSAQRACESAKIAGEPCDQDATSAIITTARQNALNLVDQNCTERQLIDLQYLGSFDSEADVVNFCRAWQTAAISAVFGPIGALSGPTPAQRDCVAAAADATDAAMQFAFRTRRQCMDRIAALPLDAPNRSTLLDVATQRITAGYAAVAARLTTRCNPASFMALYGRTPEAFVTGIGTRADCIGGQFYVQDLVLCPTSVCGNGIIEPGEDCDDGNAVDGDACPSTCILP